MLVKAERQMPQVLPFPLAAMAEVTVRYCARAIVRPCARAAARFMTALHDTRRHEAARALVHHRHLIETARHEPLDRPGSAP